MILISVSSLSSQNLEVIRRVTSLLSTSKNMQFCNEQIRTQPLYSPPCASATYGSARMCRRKNVGLNKLLTKPAYDVTVMDDLALGGASLLSAHYVPVYLKQSCWHKFVDAAKTDRIKEVRYQICICVYNNCWCDVLTVFSKRDKLEIGGVNPLETC